MNMSGNMTAHLSPTDLVVGLAVLFAVVFLTAWLISPRLRAWVERPKYRFQANVRAYDQSYRSELTRSKLKERSEGS
jgi:hypothetical protein